MKEELFLFPREAVRVAWDGAVRCITQTLAHYEWSVNGRRYSYVDERGGWTARARPGAVPWLEWFASESWCWSETGWRDSNWWDRYGGGRMRRAGEGWCAGVREKRSRTTSRFLAGCLVGLPLRWTQRKPKAVSTKCKTMQHPNAKQSLVCRTCFQNWTQIGSMWSHGGHGWVGCRAILVRWGFRAIPARWTFLSAMWPPVPLPPHVTCFSPVPWPPAVLRARRLEPCHMTVMLATSDPPHTRPGVMTSKPAAGRKTSIMNPVSLCSGQSNKIYSQYEYCNLNLLSLCFTVSMAVKSNPKSIITISNYLRNYFCLCFKATAIKFKTNNNTTTLYALKTCHKW